jgi:hypothetical protein
MCGQQNAGDPAFRLFGKFLRGLVGQPLAVVLLQQLLDLRRRESQILDAQPRDLLAGSE